MHFLWVNRNAQKASFNTKCMKTRNSNTKMELKIQKTPKHSSIQNDYDLHVEG